MAITYKVWDFPPIPIAKQLFHVPGAAVDGGFTSGGARIVSPEPGGFAILEMQPSVQVNEWQTPWASWLMSKINGQIFRIQLTKTPQLVSARTLVEPSEDAYPRDDRMWHAPTIKGDLKTRFVNDAAEGSNIVVIDMTMIGSILKVGHLIGRADNTYLIDEISYDALGHATAVVTPPLRKAVAANDTCLFSPFFLGSIANGGEIRNTYDASMNGNIQLEKIIFNEVILP